MSRKARFRTSCLEGNTLGHIRVSRRALFCLVAEGQGPTAEQQMQLQRLMQSLKQIEEQQKELQAAIQTAKAERESMLKKDRDFYDPPAKDLPPPRMEVRTLCTPADTVESLSLHIKYS